MLLASALFAALFAAAPIASMTEDQLDQKLASTSKMLDEGQKIDTLSQLFVGLPYVEYPLGEGGAGPEPQPRWRLDGVDCQTFVETVLALANAKTTSHAKKILDDIRYGKENISFAARNHFTEAQWLPMNLAKGYLDDEVPTIDGNAPGTDLVLKKSSWSKVPGFDRLAAADIPDGKFPVRYLPIAEFKKKIGSVQNGSIILVVRKFDPKRVVRTSHMGFMLRNAHGVIVRHATSGPEHKVIDEPLDAYLKRMTGFKKWPVVGFGLVMPLDAKVRASQIQP